MVPPPPFDYQEVVKKSVYVGNLGGDQAPMSEKCLVSEVFF